MPSLKDRMAAFQTASAPDAFQKQNVAKKAPGKVSKLTPQMTAVLAQPKAPAPNTPAKGPPPAPISLAKPKGPTTGKVVENKISPKKDGQKDWNYIFELAQLYDNYKAQEIEEKKQQANAKPVVSSVPDDDDEPPNPAVKKDIRAALEGIVGGNYTAKCDWMDAAWVTKHLVEDKKFNTLSFKFNDPKLFKKFDKTDEKNRDAVIEKFIDTLLSHPRAKEITKLDFFNSLMPDRFLEVLAEKILAKPGSALPKLQLMNLESNEIQGPGVIEFAKVIKDGTALKYLQVLLLENQKKAMGSDAELALADAIAHSESIVVCSLRVRGAMERNTINNTIASNIDAMRQARREIAAKNGTLKERKRNEMEQYFDKIAANDPSIKEVDLVGNQKFLALKGDEKTKSGASFANNSHVKNVKMVQMALDDKFAVELGKALETNNTIEKLLLDNNAFSGDGIRAIFAGLGKNSSIQEVQVRHQSKKMASTDESQLPGLLEPNTTIIKLGVDLRDQLAKMNLDRKTNANREHQRKLRAQKK